MYYTSYNGIERTEMGAYIIGIAAATVIASIISMMTPDRWDKYVGVVTGIVVTICIARPIINLINMDLFEPVSDVKTTDITDVTDEYANEIKKEMESRIAMDVKKRLSDEFGKDCVASVTVNVTQKGEVLGIDEINVRGDKIDAVAKSRLREVYDATEVNYAGP